MNALWEILSKTDQTYLASQGTYAINHISALIPGTGFTLRIQWKSSVSRSFALITIGGDVRQSF